MTDRVKMPRYSRSRYSSRYRSYRRGWRRYYRRKFRRGFSRFVNGSSKSMVRVKVPVSAVFQVASVTSAGVLSSNPVSPFLSSANPMSALTSPLYRLYTGLYDEVKCIGMKAVISIGTPIGTSTVPSLTIVTAFDRRYGNSGETPTFSDLLNYSSQQKATAVNNSIAKLVRSVYASDLMEKAQWHDCSLSESGGTYSDVARSAAGANPNFFSPAMFLGMSQTGSTAQNINIQVDVMYYFGFRNPKFGAAASFSKGVSFADPEFETLEDEDDDMDTKRGDAELEATAAALRSARIADSGSRMSAKLRADARAKLMDDKVIQKR